MTATPRPNCGLVGYGGWAAARGAAAGRAGRGTGGGAGDGGAEAELWLVGGRRLRGDQRGRSRQGEQDYERDPCEGLHDFFPSRPPTLSRPVDWTEMSVSQERGMIQRRKVGIVGTGNVGVAAAYALFLRRQASDIVLIDKDMRRAEGEAMDLMHGQSLVGRATVRAGSYE